MVDITELAKGKDKTSGHIVSHRVLGKTQDFATSGLYHIVLELDTKQRIYLNSSLEYLEQILLRKSRTATFIGDYLNEEQKHMGCDAVVFWENDDETPVAQ